MTTILDIDSLKALQAIQKEGGITRAAYQLELSQSAVSHKIKRLENRLNCRLLNRQSGLPLFTESGTQLLNYAARILALHDEALHMLSQNTIHGKIRIGITEDMTGTTLATIMARFKQQYPNVTIRAQIDQSLTLSQDILGGKLDITVMQVFQDEITSDDTVLATEKLHWVKAAHIDVPRHKTIPFLAFDQNCFYKNWVFENQEKADQFEIVMTCPSNKGICSAIEAGLGIAILNERYISQKMSVIDSHFSTTPPEIAYVVRKGPHSQNPILQRLTNEIVSAFVR